MDVPARIVTNSPFAPGLARITGCAIDRIPSERWLTDLPAYIAERRPRLAVLDSFPFGLRGEWSGVELPDVRLVYIARCLNVPAYLGALGMEWLANAPQLDRIIIAEPLGGDHLRLLPGSADTVTLTGRIRFPAQTVATPVPDALARLLDTGRLRLIVHSGPSREVAALAEKAREGLPEEDSGPLAAIVPQPIAELSCPCFEYYPAARLYPQAARIITGGGYNAVSEAAPFAEKHLAVPFERRYDGQAARLRGPALPDIDGTPDAAQALARWAGV